MILLRYLYVLFIIAGTLFLYISATSVSDFFYLVMVFPEYFYQVGILSLLVSPTLVIIFIFVILSIIRNPYAHRIIENELIQKVTKEIELNNEIHYSFIESKSNDTLDTRISISREDNQLIVKIRNERNAYKNYFKKIEDVIRFLECNTSVKVADFD